MAIRVLQGLIDVSRADSGKTSPSQSAAAPRAATPQANQASQAISFFQQQQQAATQAAVRTVAQDATVSNVRARAAGSEARLRDSDKAQGIADSFKSRVLEDGDDALRAHPELESDSARQHFSE